MRGLVVILRINRCLSLNVAQLITRLIRCLRNSRLRCIQSKINVFDAGKEDDEDVEQLKEKHKVQISERDATIENLQKDVIDLTTDRRNLQREITNFSL